MILNSLSPVQCTKSCTGYSRRHGFTAESRDNAKTPPDPFDEHKDDIQAMINRYTNNAAGRLLRFSSVYYLR
jgi:hypothetical protein